MLLYQIGIGLIQGIGDVRAKKLIAYCGGVEAVFKEKKQHLLTIPGIGAGVAKDLMSQNVLKRAEEEIAFIEKNGIKPLFYLDAAYPFRLKHCDDGPILIYTKGTADLNKPKVISMVGTRAATEYGKNMCKQLVAGLAEHNVLVVSGLAYGIDTASHKAALDNKLSTAAVLGHGLDMIYPAANRELARRITEREGSLITEFMSQTQPDRENFPQRNRIIAGMSDAVIVVEAAEKGGALITAEIALTYNRDVLAVPGYVNQAYSKGCNRLIKRNKAALVETAEDVLYCLGWEEKTNTKAVQQSLFAELSDDETTIVNILKEKLQTPVDEIVYKCRFTLSKTAAVLLELEFKGLINALPGKVYQLVG